MILSNWIEYVLARSILSLLRQLIARSQIGVYFTEVNAGRAAKYVPRSVQIDLEAGVLNRVLIRLSLMQTHLFIRDRR